jgi:hypothetical protein
MSKNVQPAWATGPGEILRHGLNLLREDTDVNRRLAMISIDNSVELMIKTYLGLPQRITGLKISRKDYQNFAESFPSLLDALERFASNKINGIDLGEVEWYHRLRNQLYHQGNGLTVERDKVEVYAELANLLFENLFGFRLVEPEDDATKLLGDFMSAWVDFERIITKAAAPYHQSSSARAMMPTEASRMLFRENLISGKELEKINELRDIRNRVVHGAMDHKAVISKNVVKDLREIVSFLEKKLNAQTL